MVGRVGFCSAITRTDLADADTFHAQVQRPGDHGMACFVESHRPQVVVGANFHGGYQGGARSLPAGSLPQINSRGTTLLRSTTHTKGARAFELFKHGLKNL